MISEISPSELPNSSQHSDIFDFIDKSWSKASQSSKEQQEKTINDIFYVYITKISQYIKDHNGVSLSDLLLDKSFYISDSTNCFEWPKAEALKASNLEQGTVLLYNYAKCRVMILYGHLKKQQKKEVAKKGCEVILNILKNLVNTSLSQILQGILIYSIFKDFFYFSLFNELNDTLLEEISGVFSDIYEETNISGLVKMEEIDPKYEGQVFLGALTVLLENKIVLVMPTKENKENDFINLSLKIDVLENILKHQKIVKKFSISALSEIYWFLNCYKLIEGKLTNEREVFKELNEILKEGNVVHSFMKNPSMKLGEIVEYGNDLIRTLLVILLIKGKVTLTNNILGYLNYEPNEIESISSASLSNLFPLRREFKKNPNSLYHSMNFDEKILEQLEKIKDKKDSENMSIPFREILFGKEEDTFKLLEGEDYLNYALKGKNEKFNNLTKMLNEMDVKKI